MGHNERAFKAFISPQNFIITANLVAIFIVFAIVLLAPLKIKSNSYFLPHVCYANDIRFLFLIFSNAIMNRFWGKNFAFATPKKFVVTVNTFLLSQSLNYLMIATRVKFPS